ncbi:MAG: hypothetical protein WC648_00410 [Candidatus Paceibacterota bacterium]|jgi:hypothetical protein
MKIRNLLAIISVIAMSVSGPVGYSQSVPSGGDDTNGGNEQTGNQTGGSDDSSGGSNGGNGQVECPPGFICTDTVPSAVPLASPATLKAYALTLVKPISVQVYGMSVSGDNYRSVEYTSADADPAKMAALARSQQLSFKAAVGDQLWSYVSYDSRPIPLMESNGQLVNYTFNLFSGSKAFKLEPQKGGWGIPETAYKVELDMSYVPFVVPGMQDAVIVTTDENGNQTGWYSFRESYGNYVDRGVLLLTEEMTGHRGQLIITMKNGEKISYNLKNEQRQESVSLQFTEVQATIKGVRSVPATENIMYVAGDEIIRTSAKEDMWSSITFPPGLDRYPVKVAVIETETLGLNWSAEWLEFNPYVEPVRFLIKASQPILIRFEYETDPEPLNGGGIGKS